jgi:hypothetical protein
MYTNKKPIVIRSGPDAGEYKAGEYTGPLAHLSSGEIALLTKQNVIEKVPAAKAATAVPEKAASKEGK